ncbi:hypothetical protein CC80DRAFT_358549, partial [Byssothecium circinans]
DTCCIDKTSSAELSEAINSMYKWHQAARRCYVFLFDIAIPESLPSCKWFTRGWTLQELVAPMDVAFFDREWRYLGSRFELADDLANITGIPKTVLNRTTPSFNHSVAQKMSWAAKRVTTREEDIAYCLFGIFEVNLPFLYGEGAERAFIRLQEQIMKESNDMTLFAWQSEHSDCFRGILARSPREFAQAGAVTSILHPSQNPEFTVTNKGLRIETSIA